MTRAEWVKRGVLQAGGMPVELPVHSFSEQILKPTSMLYRNMGAMEVEETLRAHPVDGSVLLGGCDKSTPALIMGAVSMGLPFIFMPAGAMLRGHHAGRTLGSGTDVWKSWDDRARRQDRQGGMGRCAGRNCAFLRNLHDDGHGVDNDVDSRGVRARAAGCLLDSRA